ncbi:hypothetical protein DICVIV_05165 [Dictyocaulus viviparus]|uniref:Teneurin NHL domain-containing protein n=1 Tax=Dictyocaulus viviparus TaxID=29172 RepID=A0A0D8XY87_DICVI|nr:hypothetical protein DICVIV_05165 [Dictyocaulus viviparus]
MIMANVRIGYEYRGCDRESEIAWINRRVYLEGAKARYLEGGAWSVNIHHYLDIVNGVIEMGNGGRRFIGNTMPLVELLAGTGRRRHLECQNCSGIAKESNLFRPSTLAHGLDGSLYIGDHNLVRRLKPNGQIITVLSLR